MMKRKKQTKRNLSHVLFYRLWLCVLVCAISVQTTLGQSGVVTVSGKVTDESGETLPGVSVRVKATTTGTVTDANGNYRFSAQGNATLVFSSVGMETQEIQVSGRTIIDVLMKESIVGIEEVVRSEEHTSELSH